MKLLLVIAMTTVLTGTAYAACSKSSPNECTDQKSCEDLSVAGGQQFTFDAKRAVKCMEKEAASTDSTCITTNQTNKRDPKVVVEQGGDKKTQGADGLTK